MECARCGAKNHDDRDYCHDCGGTLTIACPGCAFVNQPTDRFCGGCGSTLRLRHGAPSAPLLESERKYVTVLFADLRDSLELLAQRDPEDAQAVLEPVLEELIKAVHRHGGTVNQVLGDGIMALFGAPVAYEDHALRACAAALDMQAAVREVAARLRREREVDVAIRVGMNSGEVVVRATIADFQQDYSAVGETTHIAARVEQLATPGTVTLTASTLHLVEALVHVVPLGLFTIKGFPRQLELYRLVGLPAAQSRQRGARARALSTFAGRARELEMLRQLIAKARHGRGQLVSVIGEPGVGKSRLFLELLRSPAVDGALVLETGAEAYGRTGAFLPLVELLRSYLGIASGDAQEAIVAAVRARCHETGVGDDVASVVVSLLAPPLDIRRRPADAPPERREHVLESIWKLFAAEARRQPVVLVIEDLQWLDRQTQALIELLIDRLETVPLALLVSYRNDYAPPWRQRPHTQIRLEPLAPHEVSRLLDALLGQDASLTSLKASLAQHTDGNPLFVEESVRALGESHVLIGSPGRYSLTAPIPEIGVPATVRTVLAARIDRLPPDTKRVLQCAAVIGRHVRRDVLQAVAGLPGDQLDHITAELRGGAFFEATDNPYVDVFKHALTHEVAYGTLVQDRRRLLHERVLYAVEHASGLDQTERVEQLAHHAVRARLWRAAVPYLRQAAGLAVARSADADAVQRLERALDALARVEETPETLTEAVDVRLELRNALLPMGERHRTFQVLVEAERIARQLGDRQRLGWISGYLTPHLWGIGEYERALDVGRQALETAHLLGDQALEVIANRYLGHVHYSLGNYGMAVELLRRSVTSLNDEILRRHFSLPFMTAVATGSWLVIALAELGEFPEAIERGSRGIELAEHAGHSYSVAAAACGLAFAFLRAGEIGRAIATAERAVELARRREFSRILGWASAMLGYAYALADRIDDGVRLLEHATELAEKSEVKVGESLIGAALAEAYLLAGRRDDALAAASRALDIARARHERGYEGWTLRLLGRVAAITQPRDVAGAERYLRAATTIADELGMRPLRAQCDRDLADL